MEVEGEGCSKLYLISDVTSTHLQGVLLSVSVVVSYFPTPHSALELVLERVHAESFDNMIWFIFFICVASIKM